MAAGELNDAEVFGAAPSAIPPARELTDADVFGAPPRRELTDAEIFGTADPSQAAPSTAPGSTDLMPTLGASPVLTATAAPPVSLPADLSRFGVSPETALAAGPAGAIASLPPTGPVATNLPGSWFDRFKGAYQGHDSLTQNLGQILADKIPAIDPATGLRITPAEHRAQRLMEAQRHQPLPAADAGETSADLLGMMAKEATDPIALATMPIGGPGPLLSLARMAKLALAGGAYETAAATAEQVADEGQITSPGEIAVRGAAGAVIAPAGDVALRGAATKISKFLRGLTPEDLRAIDTYEPPARPTAAPPPRLAPDSPPASALTKLVDTPDGQVVEPSRAVLDALPGEAPSIKPAGPDTPPAPPPPPPEAPPLPAEPAKPDTAVRQARIHEYTRLAESTDDPEIRAGLKRQAEVLRAELAGEKPKLTAKERFRRATAIDLDKDDLAAVLRKMGGVDVRTSTAGSGSDFAGRLKHLPRGAFGLPAIEQTRGGGHSMDTLAERLHDLNFIRERSADEAYALIDRAARGEEIYSFSADPERAFAKHLPDQDRPTSTDVDWTWTDHAEARDSGRNNVLTDDGAVVIARELTLDDLTKLEKEMHDAERWFAEEGGHEPAGDARGLRGDGVPERLDSQLPGRDVEPQPGETPGLPGVEPRNPVRQALAARAAEVDARLRGPDIPPEAGKGDLFGDGKRQVDIEDAAGKPSGFKIKAPGPSEPGPKIKGGEVEQSLPADRPAGAHEAGRGTDTAPEIYLPERATETEHLAALTNYGPRVKHVKTGTFPSALTRVTKPEEVAHAVAALRKDAQESLLAVVTDGDGNVLRIGRVHRGTTDQATVDPGLAAGVAANTPGGRKVWFVHNHPSGTARQSAPDERITGRLAELLRGSGVESQGMVVVAHGGRYSYLRAGGDVLESPEGGFRIETQDITGHVEATIKAARRTEQLPITERRFARAGTRGPQMLDTPEDTVRVITGYSQGKEGIVLFDGQHRPLDFLPMSAKEMAALRQGESAPSRRLLAAFDETTASAFGAKIDAPAGSPEFNNAAGNLSGFSKIRGAPLLDVIDSADRSGVALAAVPDRSTFYANPFVYAAADLARGIGLNAGRSAAAGFAGGVAGATLSNEEVGSAKWWLDVATGAVAVAGFMSVLRRANLLGKGSIVDNARAKTGAWIESLPLIGRGPEELQTLKGKQRLMQQYLDRQTEEVGKQLLQQFTPAERAMMADLIETRGIVKDLNLIHRQAQALDDYLVRAGQRMKDLKMLHEDTELGGHLHRYYAKHLGLDKLGREAKGQTLAGSYSIARGTDHAFSKEFFSPGARAIVDEFEQVAAKIERLEGKADLLEADTAARLADLKARRRELGKIEMYEYRGQQGGVQRSFLFAKDELPRVDTGDKPVLAQLHKPEAGALDTRTMPQAPGVSDLKPTNYRWTVRGTKKDEALLHRDWTKYERQSWGEIEDAGYRYVRGMAEVSHDLSLATLFKKVADNPDWVSDTARATNGKDWVFVPDSRVGKASPLKKHGALAGQYVRPDVWVGIRNYGRNSLSGGPKVPFTEARVGDLYLGALAKWKLYKTVYNPVTHFNNSYSNVEMLHMAGYDARAIGGGLKHMMQGEASAVWREARDAGLFGTDWSTSILKPEGGGNNVLAQLAEKLRAQPEIPDAELVTTLLMDVKEWWINSKHAVAAADGAWKSGTEIAKAMAQPGLAGARFTLKPVGVAARTMQRAYKFEDEVFKVAVFAAERRAGKTADEAAQAAQRLFFDYSDVPEAIKLARDLPVGSPFITYTYKAIPAIARNIAQHPERVLALIAGYEALNYAAMVGHGMSPGEYWQTESAEDTLSPPWERGRALWGARNMVHLPSPEGYRLAIGRAHALGNPFMDEAGGREKLPTVPYAGNFWGSSAFGGSPLHALLDVSVNEDWKGKAIYKKGAPTEEKAKAIASYLFQAWAPSNAAVPGGYQQSRVLEGLANDASKARAAGEPADVIGPVVDAANRVNEALGFKQYTGEDRAENEILTRDALLASFGVKLRPVRFEQSLDFESGKLNREKKDLGDWFGNIQRQAGEGRLTDRQVEDAEAKFDRDMERIEKKETKAFDQEQFLQKRGRMR